MPSRFLFQVSHFSPLRRCSGQHMRLSLTIATVLAVSNAAAQETMPTADDATQTLDSVTVTGSRIRRSNALDGPTPLVQLGAERIRASGSTEIADVVNQLPALAVTQTDQTSNLGGNPGINALDLRGLGTQRTLVLVDGRRQVPAVPGTSAVDLSTVPSSLVERVDIITGGASALYGADAISGVANFVLKKDFSGIDASVQRGGSTRGDMQNTSVDFLAGRNFADSRGNLTFYGFWEREPDTVSGQDRPWTAHGYPMYTRASRNQRYWISDGNRNINNAEDAQVILGGHHYAFTADGRLREPRLGPGGYVNVSPVDMTKPDDALGTLLTDGGEYGGRYDSYYLAVPAERRTARASFNFDVSAALRLFANASYAQNTSQAAYRALAANGTDMVPADSPYLTDQMRAANGGSIDDGVYFARHFDRETGPARSEYRYRLLQTTAGAEGDFRFLDHDWNYAAYLAYGRTRQRNRDLGAISYDRFHLALDSTRGPDGRPVCRSTLEHPGNGCVPLNPFRRLSADALGYIQYDTGWASTVQTQKVASAYVSGGVFDLPAGAVQAVLGGEWRREDSDIGAIPQYQPGNAAYDAGLGSTQLAMSGGYAVKEAFGELHMPLLADRPLVRRLDLDAAARVSDYDTAGRTVTNQFGVEWSPISDISVRATYGRAVRAPNIGEMYTAKSISGLWITDPCNTYNLQYRTDRTRYTAGNCAVVDPSDKTSNWLYRDIISQGNLDLKPEVAKTLTAGIVLQPRFLQDFSLSVDYYDIDLSGAIDAFPAQTLIDKCVDAPSLDNAFCGYVRRDGAGNLLEVVTQKLNLAEYLTRGIDFAAHYRHDLSSLWGDKAGALTFDLNYTRLIRKDYTLDPSQPDVVSHFAGVFGSPQWKGVLSSRWSNDVAGAAWTLRHISRMRNSTEITAAEYQKVWTGNVFYSDVSGFYRFRSGIELFAGLNNAFDRAPPRVPGAESGGANFELGYQAGVYDVIGRMVYAGIRLRL